ncbi:MAG: twin-arginine translocase TatA/TatE family subunit [Chloroflexi bacterium]|nr:twin-arginine translocase TatA/TatE family subunit [Chloroflexota bacterium]MBI3931358.1 twin-arginine translocase TatA/TatE family subunit [Chloroflexota bacterium]
MGFFDMGLPEILLILIVVLIIWGPAKIPEIARTLGKMLRAFRKATSDLTTTITKELDMEEKEPPSQSRAISDAKARKSADAGKAESGNTGIASPGNQ